MGIKLMKYYDDAAKIGGIEARVALAKLTGINSIVAKSAEDKPETLKIFENAILKLKSEFKDAVFIKLESAGISNAIKAHDNRLNEALNNLQAKKTSFTNSVEATSRQVTETSAIAMDISRVSVWFINKELNAIECIDLYEKRIAKHSSGLLLYEKDFPAYFRALEFNRAINAHDANNDYRTSCFSESYLKPLGISSMLDIPIWRGNDMVGVICNEHIGPKRTWTIEEADFGVGLAGLISEAIN